jgi:antitoxin component YwqK of YwqJK toxin-antitoxin module
MFNLERLQLKLKDYSDAKYVFTNCKTLSKNFGILSESVWLIVMEKLSYTKTDEERKGIKNEKYAIYSADRVVIRKIINIDTFESVDEIIHAQNFFDDDCISARSYKKVFKVDSDVCRIHYFKDIFRACFFEHIPELYTGKYYEYYDDGQMKTDGEYLAGLEINKWQTYHNNDSTKGNLQTNQLMSSGKYFDGMKEGEWIYYHPNGIIRETGSYVKNKQIGIWSTFYSNNQMESRGRYSSDNGRMFSHKTGMWTYWHKNGKKMCEGSYTNDCHVSLWTHWNENGQKESEGFYSSDGMRIGKWNYYKTIQVNDKKIGSKCVSYEVDHNIFV